MFVISKHGFVVLHPDSPTLAINVEYRQYHARGVEPLSAEALEREGEPFQRSLEFTAVRAAATVPAPARWVSQMETGGKAADGQRWSEAEAAFKAALAEAERAFESLGLILDAQGRAADAEPLLRRALAIAEKVFGPGHPKLAHGAEDYAAVLRKLGREAEAAELAARARAIRGKAPKCP